jgi:4-amino-4-deoxy-L-arabinose transferase-like glycosyltransferase
LTHHTTLPNDLQTSTKPSWLVPAAIILAASLTVFAVGASGSVTKADEVHHYSFAQNWARLGLLNRPTFNPIYESGDPPGYYYNGQPMWAFGLAALWQVTGKHQWIAQLYQAAWYALLLAMVYRLGRKLFDERGARVSLILAASLPMFNAFSVLLYMDVPTTALATLALLLVWDRRYLLAGLAMGLGYLSKQNAVFLVPSLALWIAWRETFGGQGPWLRRLARLVQTGTMFAVPMALVVMPDVLWRRTYLPQSVSPDLTSIAHRASILISRHRLTSNLVDPVDIGMYFGGLACLGMPIYLLRRAWKAVDGWVWICLGLYLAAMTVFFSINTDIRYFMPAAPLVVLIAVRGLEPLWRRRWGWAAVVLIAAVQFAGVLGYTTIQRQLSPSQRAAFAYLRQETPEGSLMLYPGEVLATEAHRPPVWASLRNPSINRPGLTGFLHLQTPQEIADTLRGNGIRYAVVDHKHVYDDSVQPDQNGYPASFVRRLSEAPGLERIDGPWPGMEIYLVLDPVAPAENAPPVPESDAPPAS